MGKFVSFLFCAALFIVGTFGCYCEIRRLVVYNHAMSDEQWIGEIMLLLIYGITAVGSVIYAINMWRR